MRLVFDIGATTMRLGVSANGRTLQRVLLRSTPKGYTAALKEFHEMAAELTDSHAVIGAAGGVAALLDVPKGKILHAPNLPAWNNKSIAQDLSRMLKKRVVLENDCALAGVGESVKGAGKGRNIVAYIGVGTGIGGARIVDGEIDAKTVGFEPGRHLIALDGAQAGHSSIPWEHLASGSAILHMTGKPAKDVQSPAVWRSVAEHLGLGLLNVTAFWSPECIVLGGSLMKRVPIGVVRTTMKRARAIFPVQPTVSLGKLGDTAGLVGALHMLHRDG